MGRMPRWLKATLLGAGLLAPVAALHAQEARLAPVDAGASDATWVQFHKRLATAIEQRDLKTLLSVVDPKIRNSFEKPEGLKSFIEQWELEPARFKESPLWAELRTIFRFGAAPLKSASGQKLLCIPYVAVRWPPTIDPILYAAIVVPDAPVFARPSVTAPITATLLMLRFGVSCGTSAILDAARSAIKM